MKFKIDDKYIDREHIGVPAMNYGQMWRYEKFDRVNYEIVISKEGFFEKTSEWFKEFRYEVIEDSGISHRGEFPVYDNYEDAGFPGLTEMMDTKQQLLSELILFHDFDLLTLLCEHTTAPEGELYLLNSLEEVEINEYITLKGIAFKTR